MFNQWASAGEIDISKSAPLFASKAKLLTKYCYFANLVQIVLALGSMVLLCFVVFYNPPSKGDFIFRSFSTLPLTQT